MFSLLHTEFARSADAAAGRSRRARAAGRAVDVTAPPGRFRPRVAYVLGAAAGRVDREVARRAVA